MNLPMLPDETKGDRTTARRVKPALSRMNTSVQMDIARHQCYTAEPHASPKTPNRRSSMTALHSKRSVPTLPSLPAAEQYGLWKLAPKSPARQTLQKSMSFSDMLHTLKALSPPKKKLDPWTEPPSASRPHHYLKRNPSGGAGGTFSLRHMSHEKLLNNNEESQDSTDTAPLYEMVSSLSDDEESQDDVELIDESVDLYGETNLSFQVETEVGQDPKDQTTENNFVTQRRHAMSDITHFADVHWRKKLFKGWDAIEFAFSGGDLNQQQVERVLHTNGISSTQSDVERVRQKIQAFMARKEPEDTITDSMHVHVNRPVMISIEMMSEMFYPKNPDDIKRWREEMESEKIIAEQEQADRDSQLQRLEDKIKRRLESTAQAMLRVIDRFDFMNTTWPDQTTKQTATQRFFKLIFRKKKLLLEQQTDGQMLRRNRGLGDIDAAQVFHDVAANVIQNGAQQYFDRKATFWCPERQAFFAYKLKKRLFRSWLDRAHQLAFQREILFRKVIAWRFHVKQEKRYREMFRICFWPLYVWKRYVQFILISRSKSIFLLHVYQTYLQLRVIRELRRYVARRKYGRAVVQQRKCARNACLLHNIITPWRAKARASGRLKEIWNKRGLWMNWQNKHYTIRVTIHLWRYYTILKRDIERRKYLCFHGVLTNRNDQPESENERVPLTRIMESQLGPKIRLKSYTHDLGIAMFIKYRKKDRQMISAMALVFKRVAPVVFRKLVAFREQKKRGRFATEFGLFRLYSSHFTTWVAFLIYRKQQEAKRRATLKKILDNAQDTSPVKDEESKPISKRALQWRADREWRDQGIIQAAIDASALAAKLEQLNQDHAASLQRYLDRGEKLREMKQAEIRLQQEEEKKTTGMGSQLHHCASQILHTRVRRLYETICRTFDVLQDKYNRMLLKSTFRSLRIPVSLKHSKILCNRSQLRNWIRLARCFEYWQSHIEQFSRLKRMWSIWRKWIDFIRTRALYESRGLALQMQRRRMLVAKFEAYLLKESFMLIPSVLGKKLSYNSFKAVFVRWVEWTQLTLAANAMTRIVLRMAIRRLGKVFLTWKVQLKAKYVALPCFVAEKRATADIERVRSSLWNKRKYLVSRKIRRVLTACDRKLKLSVCSNPTLKHLFAMHSKDIMNRLSLENRLMFVAYNERHIHHFEERLSPLMGGPSGQKFDYLETIPFGHITQITVICGKSVDGLSIIVKSHSSTVEGKIHGNPFGNSSNFALAADERLIALEGYATQTTVLGLRFGTSASRWSKWYGRCDAGLHFFLHADSNEEIVGFHGYAAKESVHGLGVCFRKTTERNIFEGLWIEHPAQLDGIDVTFTDDRINNCDRQFSYFLQMRSCDVYAAMDRSHKLALRMWRSETIPDELRRLRIVMGVCRWLFNSLVHGLVALTNREDEGRRILQDGINIRASGEKLLAEGEAIMQLVNKYREGRKKQLNLALLGSKKIQELRHNMEVGDDKIKRGKALIAEGNAAILQGKQLLPRIPMTDRMLKNIRGLYRVVQTKDSMDSMSESIKKLLLSDQIVVADTTWVDMKEVAEANETAAFDMGQARAEVVSSKLRESLSRGHM
ncbi:hypothetical protein AeMF1_013889 [Aphanomyces euteiches]|nr:hypothetical protein AeMF1_013889 [Aphanomyces euteiches]KAH9194930.1 hypothetical protein AeNC1_003104 [Aphanomyces euteiches]